MARVLKITILFTFLVIYQSVNGQNLIERVKQGKSSLSTEISNRLWNNIKSDHQKSDDIENRLSIFQLSNKKATTGDQVNLELSKTKLEIIKKWNEETFLIDIPVDRFHNILLALKKTQPFLRDYNLKDEKGNDLQKSNLHFYKGIINDDHGSIASMTIINDEVHISISDKDGNYRVGKSKENENYKLYADDSISEGSTSCGSIEPYHVSNTTHNPASKHEKAAGDPVHIYIECDYELYIDKNGVAGVEAYVAQLFNEVSTLYANEGIPIVISEIKVWTIPDPYRNISRTRDLLSQFSLITQNNYNGRLAAFLGGNRTDRCSLGGYAHPNVLCESYSAVDTSGPYSITTGLGFCSIGSYPTFSYDVSIVTHELGHNFGSPHTHNCSWGPSGNQAIDACQYYTEGNCTLITSPTPAVELNTIMSYCSNIDFTRGFGTLPGNLIRDRYNSCMASGGNPCTDIDMTYIDTTLSSNILRIDNNITLNNNVTLASGALVNWFFENELIVNGTFTVPTNATLEAVVDDCE